MSKTVRERALDTPAARARLKVAAKPYWRAVDVGLHLGYGRGLNGGHWVLRRYLAGEKYEVRTFAIADDHTAADGEGILDFFQAQRKARELAAAGKTPAALTGPLTVAGALAAYFERLESMGKSKSLPDMRGRAKKHVIPGRAICPSPA